MAVAVQDRKRVSSELKSWLDDVAAYERAFKEWEGRVEKILTRYRDDPRSGKRSWADAHFNILWANVQTLSAATFSKLPKPDVSRRYKDQDQVGRIASLILERDLDYHIQHYPEYRMALKAAVLDRFLGARGTSWVRYEPHFRAAQSEEPTDGAQITEDVDTPDEELDYECVAVDYVHMKDFGHSVARTWEEVTRVWRKVYMTRDALTERFGEDVAKLVPLDADPRQKEPDKAYGAQEQRMCATVYEGWDKATRQAVWFSKSVKDFLDVKDDPLGLDGVFPCPRPLYGTLTNDSLVPVPDFTLYQDQANQLDLLADRIDGLVKALKVCGGYDASIPELQRIFTEAEQGTLIPVKNWAAFAEKNGLTGALSLVDLTPTANALTAAYEAFEQVKQQIHEITGISDIIRGQTQASETATAQQIKGQYASLRLKTYQDEVALYASELLSIMAQVVCRKFSPQTIGKIAGVEQFSPQDQPLVPQALALLVGEQRMQDPDAEEGPNPAREFRIEVAADSMVYLDEQAEQQARTEFLAAVGTYLQNVAKSVQGMPQPVAAVLIPLLMDMMKFGVTGYRVGKNIEGAFDEAAEQLKMLAKQPPQPQVPPEVQVEQMKQQTEMQRMQAEHAMDREKSAQELQLEREKHMQTMQFEREKHAQTMQQNAEQFNAKLQTDASLKSNEIATHADLQSRKQESDAELGRQKIDSAARPQGMQQLAKLVQQLAKASSAPKRIVRGPDGKAVGVETVTPEGEEPQADEAMSPAQEEGFGSLVQKQQEMMAQMMAAFAQGIQQLAQVVARIEQSSNARKRIVRGPDGRVSHVETERETIQ